MRSKEKLDASSKAIVAIVLCAILVFGAIDIYPLLRRAKRIEFRSSKRQLFDNSKVRIEPKKEENEGF